MQFGGRGRFCYGSGAEANFGGSQYAVPAASLLPKGTVGAEVVV